MRRVLALLLTAACVGAGSAHPVLAQEAASPPAVRAIQVVGARELPPDAIVRAAGVRVGDAVPAELDPVAARVEARYHDEGYTFAHAAASFDTATGTLTLRVDEGVIDAVAFEGVDANLAASFASDFALRAGDVFNQPRALHALNALLRRTRGAVRQARQTFDLVDRNGERVLVVDLREPAGRFRLLPDLGEREDWFTPVDGFVPSVGFGAAVFDHESFNHAFVAGHVSLKAATGHAGYALGFERPFFQRTKLFVGGEVRDLTATDDRWQLSSTEASLAAAGPRRSYRDYYRGRGVQIQTAIRIHPRAELFAAWRHERQEPLAVESDFSVWNGDQPFRANRAAADGVLSALIVGATIDGSGFDGESLEQTYRRHQLDTLFGQRLRPPENDEDPARLWRLDWTSELSTSGLQSDFDFRRHIVAGRVDVPLSQHQDFAMRAIGGWSAGTLPPQRQFSVGGIGTVHGYDFDEQIGDSLTLLNLEYALGDRTGLRAIGFFDAGRAIMRQPAGTVAPDTPWLTGVGFGIGMGGVRVDFGYKLDAVPSSLQILLRFVRTF